MENHYNCIYMYTNKINGKRYVGQAKNFNKRHREHINRNGITIDRAITKYGIDNFDVVILKEDLTTQCLLDMWESYYINKFNTLRNSGEGYNVSDGGNKGSCYGGLTDEERQELCQKISDGHADVSGANNPRALAVICLNTGEEFDCAEDGAKWCERNAVGIRNCCKGKGKSCGQHPITGEKLQWCYKEDFINGKRKLIDDDKLHRTKEIPVICLTTMEIFDSAKKASDHYNLNSSNIVSNCKHKKNYSYVGKHPLTKEKLRWVYLSEYIIKYKQIEVIPNGYES